jgi:hypothetical protein
MSINLLKIIKNLLTPPSEGNVCDPERIYTTNNASQAYEEKNQLIQPDNLELTSNTQNSEPLLSSQALLAIFSKVDCCTLDGLNEYDDDFTSFTPLGDLVTHEMRNTVQRLAEQTLEKSELETTTEFEQITAQPISDKSQQR